jgi:hypothetical protein
LPPGPALNERDSVVVRAIESEGLSTFTFDGVRRLTGVHPETLSRSLLRLEEEGTIARIPEGYAVVRGKAQRVQPAHLGEKRVQILSTFLPYGVTAAGVASTLRGRWFDRVRWVGMSEGDEEMVLKWTTEDGSVLIDLRLSEGQMEVEARVKKDDDIALAVRAAHQLMARISRLYPSRRQAGRRSLAVPIGYFRPLAM